MVTYFGLGVLRRHDPGDAGQAGGEIDPRRPPGLGRRAQPERDNDPPGSWGIVPSLTSSSRSFSIAMAAYEPPRAPAGLMAMEVFVASQGSVATDPSGTTRIGRYDLATGRWTWYGYRLDPGSTVGVSELVALGRNRFAVLERDNLSGPTAAVKRIYTVDLEETTGSGELPLLRKTLARDLLPHLQATNGWVQEDVEGLTVGADRRVYLVTDNDGVEDATGETVFLDLGPARRIFGRTH